MDSTLSKPHACDAAARIASGSNWATGFFIGGYSYIVYIKIVYIATNYVTIFYNSMAAVERSAAIAARRSA